ncbi:FAD binding domain-containing protein [Mycena galericulata]|nr:FAD binding domain-containing protein [Mycena galericulata]
MPAPAIDSPVLIVGAGPAGLLLALFLAQSGITPRIIDKDPVFHTGSRGFGIQPRTLELLQTLNLLPDVLKEATPIPTLRAYALPGGREVVRTWDLYPTKTKKGKGERGEWEGWADRPFANGLCLSQSALEGIIRAHLARFGVVVERGCEMVGFMQGEGEDSVRVRVRDVETGAVEETRAAYMVGADGARGPTRRLLGLMFEGETKDADGMVWGDVEIEGLGTDYWHIWGKPGHFTIMARPLTPGGPQKRFGIGITGLDFDPAALADSEDSVTAFIRAQTGRAELRFGAFEWLSYFKPNMRMVNKFGEGRVFLVGDAAHVHSPTGGQGVNTSVQDSSNLAWKLALVLHGRALPALLKSYNAERLPVVAQMLLATSAIYTHTVAPVQVQAQPPNANSTTPKEKEEEEDDDTVSGWFRWRNSALEMFGINYRYSPIVLHEALGDGDGAQSVEEMRARAYEGYEGTGTLRAGDRAPEASGLVLLDATTTLAETSLFDLLDSARHTILVFIPSHTALSEPATVKITSAVATYPADAVQIFAVYRDLEEAAVGSVSCGTRVADTKGHAFGAYLIEDEGRIVVVRPDGFIGAMVRDGDGMEQYCRNIFGEAVQHV